MARASFLLPLFAFVFLRALTPDAPGPTFDPADPVARDAAAVDEDAPLQGAVCGDSRCSPPEDCNTCPQDCGECCGDRRCAPPEDCRSCPADCGPC